MEHAIQGFPLVETYRIPHEHYLLSSPTPQEILTIEPIHIMLLYSQMQGYSNRISSKLQTLGGRMH